MNPFEDEIRNQTNSTTQGTAGMNPFEDEVVKSTNPFDGAVNNSRPFDTAAVAAVVAKAGPFEHNVRIIDGEVPRESGTGPPYTTDNAAEERALMIEQLK